MGSLDQFEVNDFDFVSHPCTDDRITLPHPTVPTKHTLSSGEKHVDRVKISSKTFSKTSGFWMYCSSMAVVFPWSLKWDFGWKGRRATRMLARYEVFYLIVEFILPRLKYTDHSFMSPKKCVGCVWSELPDKGRIVAPSGRRSYWSGQDHCSYDAIQLTYLFIPSPVTWFHLWVDTFLSFIEFLCWSIPHMVPERRVLHEKLNSFNRIPVKGTCAIIVVKVFWIGSMIVTPFAQFSRVDAHHVEHFVQQFQQIVGRSEVAQGCHWRVPEKLFDSSSAQVVLDAPVR